MAKVNHPSFAFCLPDALKCGKCSISKPFISWQALFILSSLMFLLIYSLRQFLLCQLLLLHGEGDVDRSCTRNTGFWTQGLMDILQLLHVSSSAFSFGFLQYPLKGNSRNKKNEGFEELPIFSVPFVPCDKVPSKGDKKVKIKDDGTVEGLECWWLVIEQDVQDRAILVSHSLDLRIEWF